MIVTCRGTYNQGWLWSRSFEPEPKRFWMAGAGAKIFLMVEPKPEPEICVAVPQT